MDGDRPVVDGRDIFESKLQELVRKVWHDACKYGDVLYYAGVDKEVFLRGYDCDIHELLISYLDGPTSDAGTQDEVSEEGTMGDGVRQEEYIECWYEGEIPEGWKKSPNAIASDFFRQYSGQYRRLQNPR